MITKQETFDTVVRHLGKQREKSLLDMHCMDRGRNGTMCAAGCLIPDESYSEDFEGGMIRTTFSDEGDDKSSVLVSRLIESLDHDIRLVRALQHTHDNSEVKEWPDVLLAVACEYSLDGSIIAEAFA